MVFIMNQLKARSSLFVWDQSAIRIIGLMQVSVCLGAILIPESPDIHSSYSASRSRIAGIYSGIYSYSGISQTNAPLSEKNNLMIINIFKIKMIIRRLLP